MIKTAQIISDDSKEDEVGMNNTVELYFEEDGETETYKLVTTVRENSLKGLISNESPLGRAIMGRRTGERVFVKVSDTGGYYVVIRSVKKTMDENEEIRRY